MTAVESELPKRVKKSLMLALIVKPRLRGTNKFEKVLDDLSSFSPVILEGDNPDSLKGEIEVLSKQNSDLTVVACGGDGTFHLALNALPDLGIPLAVLPMGTGNDFARYLKIRKPKQGALTLQNLSPVSMDMGTIELSDGKVVRFAGIASCGFDAQVNERANGYRGPAGTLKYLAALSMELVNLESRELTVAIDGSAGITATYTLIAVGNTSSYGGGLRMCPTANAYDQAFETTFVEKVSRRLLVRVLPKVFWGGHTKHRQVTQASLQEIHISGEDFPVYADGERIGHGPVVITLHPGAMRVWQAQPTPTP
jgi:diacylglycerol kinase (ATP)